MNSAVVTLLRILLVATIILLVVAQLFALPETADTWAGLYPQLAWLRTPGLIIAVAFIVCVQVVLACLWRMLGIVAEDGPFSQRSLGYITVIIAAIIAADLLIVAAILLLAAAQALNPSILLLGGFGVVVGAVLALLVGVMRTMLRRALDLQHDLSEVV